MAETQVCGGCQQVVDDEQDRCPNCDRPLTWTETFDPNDGRITVTVKFTQKSERGETPVAVRGKGSVHRELARRAHYTVHFRIIPGTSWEQLIGIIGQEGLLVIDDWGGRYHPNPTQLPKAGATFEIVFHRNSDRFETPKTAHTVVITI